MMIRSGPSMALRSNGSADRQSRIGSAGSEHHPPRAPAIHGRAERLDSPSKLRLRARKVLELVRRALLLEAQPPLQALFEVGGVLGTDHPRAVGVPRAGVGG